MANDRPILHAGIRQTGTSCIRHVLAQFGERAAAPDNTAAPAAPAPG